MTSLLLDQGLSEIQLRGIAARDGDVSDYSVAVHDWSMEPYQESWAEVLESENKTLIICPPDTRKSTTVQCWIEKKIGENPNIRILWLMKAGAQAQARVMAVAETIESNQVFREAFPEVLPNKNAQWSKTALYVTRSRHGPDPTLMGCGFNGPYQGFHFDIIVIDDPTNQQDVRSPSTMEDQRGRVRGVIYDRLVEDGRFVAILTRWGEDDLVPVFHELGFNVITMPIIGDYPWGPTISNKRFPLSRCEQIRIDKTDAIFGLTFMCDPYSVEGGIIRRSYLRYWGPENMPLNGTVSLMALDLAASTRNWADPSVIGTGILEVKTRKMFVADIWAKRCEALEFETEFLRRAKHTQRLVSIGVETIGYQLSFLQRLKKTSNLPVKELKYRTKVQNVHKPSGLDRDKMGRAIYVAQRFNANQLFLPKNSPYVEGISLESELVSFPFGKHDDRMDVIAFLCAMADGFSSPKIVVNMGYI